MVAHRYSNKFGDIKFKYGANETVDVLNTGHGTMQVSLASVIARNRSTHACKPMLWCVRKLKLNELLSHDCSQTASIHHHTQVNFRPGNTAVVGGSELELVQFHFHTPSEHTFDGAHTSLEVHLVSEQTHERAN